jgi:hypothetical protein
MGTVEALASRASRERGERGALRSGEGERRAVCEVRAARAEGCVFQRAAVRPVSTGCEALSFSSPPCAPVEEVVAHATTTTTTETAAAAHAAAAAAHAAAAAAERPCVRLTRA